MNLFRTLSVVLTLLIFAGVVKGEVDRLIVEDFSGKLDKAFPPEWRNITFKKISPTEYSVVKEGDNFVLKAASKSSGSMLSRELEIDLLVYGSFRWRWKVEKITGIGQTEGVRKDDFPLRIIIAFEYLPERAGLWERTRAKLFKSIYGKYPPGATIGYVWAPDLSKGEVIPNSHHSEISKIVIVEGGSNLIGKWVEEERNIYRDYQDLFGEKPPLIVGISLMTDTDDTKGEAVAYYDDISFQRATNKPDETKD